MTSPIFLVPAAFFSFLAAVLIAPAWLAYRSRSTALRVIAGAIEKERPLDAPLIDRLLSPKTPNLGKGFAAFNMVIGVMAMPVGVALGVAANLPPGDPQLMWGSLVNVCAGAGFLTLGVVMWRLFARNAVRWDALGVLALICLFLGIAGLSVSVALFFAGAFYSPPQSQTLVSQFMPALVNFAYGAGLTALGVFFLRFSHGEQADA